MNIESGNFNKKENTDDVHDLENFYKQLDDAETETTQMLNAGEAYVQDEVDDYGNLKTFKIFKNDGTLIYFSDEEGLSRAYAKFRGKKDNKE